MERDIPHRSDHMTGMLYLLPVAFSLLLLWSSHLGIYPVYPRGRSLAVRPVPHTRQRPLPRAFFGGLKVLQPIPATSWLQTWMAYDFQILSVYGRFKTILLPGFDSSCLIKIPVGGWLLVS